MTNVPQPIEQQNETAVTKEDENGLMTALEHGLEEIATQPPAVLVVDVVKLDMP